MLTFTVHTPNWKGPLWPGLNGTDHCVTGQAVTWITGGHGAENNLLC